MIPEQCISTLQLLHEDLWEVLMGQVLALTKWKVEMKMRKSIKEERRNEIKGSKRKEKKGKEKKGETRYILEQNL